MKNGLAGEGWEASVVDIWRAAGYRCAHDRGQVLHSNVTPDLLALYGFLRGRLVNELLNKISSYNIFNYLFPGAVFSILADWLGVKESPDDIIKQLLWYYFVGMVISRVGSVMLEPILRRASFIEYSDYSKYLRACASDPKLDVMVEVANTYRTLASAFAILLLILLCDWIAEVIGIPIPWIERAALLLLCVLFLLSFKKQSDYVTKRVNHHGGV